MVGFVWLIVVLVGVVFLVGIVLLLVYSGCCFWFGWYSCVLLVVLVCDRFEMGWGLVFWWFWFGLGCVFVWIRF